MSDYSNFNWFKKALNSKSMSASDFEKIINKYGLESNARQIGSLRKEFEDKVPPNFWQIVQRRGELLREHLDKKVTTGKAKLCMFPIMQEEFSLDLDFLRYAFPLPDFPALLDSSACKVVTIGSCFASNVSESLSRQGVTSSTCRFNEDINTPISLYSMLSVADQVDTFIRQMRERFQVIIDEKPEFCDLSEIESYLDHELKRMQNLFNDLRQSDCVIVTFGNTLEWDTSVRLFLNHKVDPVVAMKAFNRKSPGVPMISYEGDSRRPASFSIVSDSIEKVLHKLRELTDGMIICTISPIPIRGISGKNVKHSNSAITENNLSKSYLRSALDEVLDRSDLENVYYFPSFEIATDVALRIPGVGFGNDDANSRHLDLKIIDSICKFFVFKMFPDLRICIIQSDDRI